MIDLLCCFCTHDHPIRLSVEFQRDIQWWSDFLTSWGPQWYCRHVLFRSDNEAMVHILTSRTSKIPCIMQLLCHLLSSAARYNFTFKCGTCPAFTTRLPMLSPVFVGRNSGVWLPKLSYTRSQYLTSMGSFDTPTLEAQCRNVLVQGLALSTRSSYASGQKKFLDFCTQLSKVPASGPPCPADGPSAFSPPFWPTQCNTPQSRCIFQPFVLCILNRASRTGLLIA